MYLTRRGRSLRAGRIGYTQGGELPHRSAACEGGASSKECPLVRTRGGEQNAAGRSGSCPRRLPEPPLASPRVVYGGPPLALSTPSRCARARVQAKKTLLKTESEAKAHLNLPTWRTWKFENPDVLNAMGDPVRMCCPKLRALAVPVRLVDMTSSLLQGGMVPG